MTLKLDVKKIILEKLANYDISNNNLIFLYELLNKRILNLNFKSELIDKDTVLYKSDNALIKFVYKNYRFEFDYKDEDKVINISYSRKDSILKICELFKEGKLIIYELLGDIGSVNYYSNDEYNAFMNKINHPVDRDLNFVYDKLYKSIRVYDLDITALFYFDTKDSYNEVLNKLKYLEEENKMVLVSYVDNDKKNKIL